MRPAPAKDVSYTTGDPARRDCVRDIAQWCNNPDIQRRMADLIAGGRGSGHEPDTGADGDPGGQ